MTETILTLAALIVANSLFIHGFSACFADGMIFGGIAKWIEGWDKSGNIQVKKRARIPKWLQKPLYACPTCMASIWGTVGYFVGVIALQDVLPLSWAVIAFWPVYVVCLAGLNSVIIGLYPCCDE